MAPKKGCKNDQHAVLEERSRDADANKVAGVIGFASTGKHRGNEDIPHRRGCRHRTVSTTTHSNQEAWHSSSVTAEAYRGRCQHLEDGMEAKEGEAYQRSVAIASVLGVDAWL